MDALVNLVHGNLIVTFPTELTEYNLDHLKTKVLERLTAGNIRGVVFDLCPVNIMDDQEFGTIIELTNMSQVLGAEAVITGLQPGVVAALVDMNIDTDAVKAFLNLESALTYFYQKAVKNPVETEIQDESLESAAQNDKMYD